MLTSPARLCRPRRLAGPVHAAATAGFSIQEGEIPRETDCLLEGAGFELLVPRHKSRGFPQHSWHLGVSALPRRRKQIGTSPNVAVEELTHRWRKMDSNFQYAVAVNLVIAPFVQPRRRAARTQAPGRGDACDLLLLSCWPRC